MGDLDADFGFAGMFWATEIELNLTKFRVYAPSIGRWLSRDPLLSIAEIKEDPNLYAYALNDPINLIDILGLESCVPEKEKYYFALLVETVVCAEAILGKDFIDKWANRKCYLAYLAAKLAQKAYYECLKHCPPPPPPPPPPQPCKAPNDGGAP